MRPQDRLRAYLDKGWQPIPLHHVQPDGICTCPLGPECGSPGKHPLFTSWRKPVEYNDRWFTWWAAHPAAGVGLVTGGAFWVLDVDPAHGGDERLAELVAQHGPLPATYRVATPSGGWHLYFALPAGVVITNAKGELPRGLDVRGEGGQVAAPWSAGYVEDDPQAPVVPAPSWLVDLITRAGGQPDPSSIVDQPGGVRVSGLDAYLSSVLTRELEGLEEAQVGERNDVLNRRMHSVATLFDCEGVPVTFETLARDTFEATARGLGLPAGEVRATIASAVRAGRAKPRTPWPPPELPTPAAGELTELAHKPGPGNPMSDANMAELVAREVLADRYAWVTSFGWHRWDGRRWTECSEEAVMDEVRRWVLAQCRTIAATFLAQLDELARVLGICDDDDERAELETRRVKLEKKQAAALKGWIGLQSRSRRKAIVADAAGIVERDVTAFDADPDLLNTPSGIVDLRTGEVRPHDPGLLMMKITHAEYAPGFEHPAWATALEALPADVVPWYQVYAGQSATGWTMTEDWLLVTSGAGENGKGVVNNEGIRTALGDYAAVLSERVLLANPGDHPVELMALRGLRLALLDETPEARHLDTQRLKRVIGQPTITSRPLYKPPVEFPTSHTLLINTNHLPKIAETDHGTWRRLRTLRFPYTFVAEPSTADERQADLGVKDALREPDAQKAVLAWVVDGARRWYEGGRRMPSAPERVAADTAAWRAESDLLMSYLTERLVPEMGALVSVGDVIVDLTQWLEERGQQPWSVPLLRSRLRGHELCRRWSLVLERPSVDRTSAQAARVSRRPSAGMMPLPLPNRFQVFEGLTWRRAENEVPGLDLTGDLAVELVDPFV